MRKYQRILVLMLCLLITVSCCGAKKKESPIPKMIGVQQIAPNTIKITYDKEADASKAANLKNYWIQSLTDNEPDDIASLGKGGQAETENTLSEDKAQIIAQDNTNKAFLIRFKQKIPSGKQYKVIVRCITAPKSESYTGNNGEMTFTGK